MKLGGKTIWALSGVLLSIGVQGVTADSAESPYHGIVDRNVFNLHPPPPPPSPESLIKKEPLPKITLNGITTILGKKITFLTIPGPKPGTPPETLMLAEGQAQSDIEVKEIDEKAGVVKVLNHSEPQTLDFDHDGAKPVNVPQPPPGPTGMPTPFPAIPAAPPPPNVNPGSQPTIIRPMRNLQQRSPALGGGGGGPFGGGLGGGAFGTAANTSAQNATPLTSEQAEALVELQHQKMVQAGDPTAKIMPPTQFRSAADQEFGGATQ